MYSHNLRKSGHDRASGCPQAALRPLQMLLLLASDAMYSLSAAKFHSCPGHLAQCIAETRQSQSVDTDLSLALHDRTRQIALAECDFHLRAAGAGLLLGFWESCSRSQVSVRLASAELACCIAQGSTSAIEQASTTVSTVRGRNSNCQHGGFGISTELI